MGFEVPVSGDDAKAAVTNTYPVYPAGEYIGQIVDVKLGAVKNGASKGYKTAEVQFKFTESGTGEGIGKKYKEFQVPLFSKWASDKSAFLFYQFFGALGVEFPKDGTVELPDLEDWFGEEVGIRLTVVEKVINGVTQTDDDGNPVLQNRTGGFFPASKGVKESAAVAEDSFTL